MQLRTRLSYSIASATLVTALFYFFYHQGGELFIVPGLIFEGWLNILIILITDDPYKTAPQFWDFFFNVLIYSVFFFIAIMLVTKKQNK